MKMRATPHLIWAAILCLSTPAFAVYKCESNGHVTYSDSSCPGGRQLDIPPAPDSAEARQRAVQEQQALKRLENERRKAELQEAKGRQQAANRQAARRRKCASLERRKKWAAEDAATTYIRSAEKAKRKARRAEETFEAECRT